MIVTRNWRTCVSSLVIVVIFLSSNGLAQATRVAKGQPNPDEPVIHDYILTMDKVRTYAAFGKKAEAAAQADPSLAAEMQKIEEADVYNVQKAAMIEKSPRLVAFLRSNGTTARDFIFTANRSYRCHGHGC